ncbi:hypothetical protein MRX96_058774 [Rhipicephalus microplus]
MPIRLPTLAIRWSQARRTCAALPTSTKVGAKDHFRRRSRVRAYSRQKNEASKGLAASAFKCRDVQVPRSSVLPLSASRCGTFPKRADPLIATSATWPCRLSLGSKQNVWQCRRSPNHDLAPCFVWRIQKPAGRCCNHYGRYAYAAEGGTVIGACGSSIEYCAPRPSHRRAMTSRVSTRTGVSEIPRLQEPTGSLRHPRTRRRLPRTAERYALVHSGPVTSPVP